MTYPTIDRYVEAVQNPNSFVDPVLRSGKVATNSLGLPAVLGGGFALTFTVSAGGKKYAVRCFHKQAPDIVQRYEKISQGLSRASGTYFVEFELQPSGIRVDGAAFPIVKMSWADGATLGSYVEDNSDNRQLMENLRRSFRELEASLRKQSIAHGDLQNGNVLIGRNFNLIDYDGVYVPGMRAGNGTELGQKNFQHPRRTTVDFGPEMDRFSFILIDVSLAALVEHPKLFQAHSNGENLIFSANDLADPYNSRAFADVKSVPALAREIENLARICTAQPSQVPTLEDFLAGRNIPANVTIVGPQIQSAPRSPSKPAPYIGAFSVVDASNFPSIMNFLGDKVELVGCIAQMQIGKTRYKRPYAFILFGPKDRDIGRITIWSEGLARLASNRVVPDKGWIGKWVSITGLVEKPYTYPKKGNRHVGVTISDSSQIRFISHDEAKRRLSTAGSNSRPTAATRQPFSADPARSGSRNAGILQGIGVKPTPTSAPSPIVPRSSQSTPVDLASKNAAVLASLGGGQRSSISASSTASTPPLSPLPPTTQVSKKRGVPVWVWFVVGFIILVMLAHLH